MLKISFEVNGKKVNPNNIDGAIEAAVLSNVSDHLKKAVGSVRCSEHGESPAIKVKGRNLENLSFEISGCCEALVEHVKEKLK
jgi:hypothetical protein